MDCHEEGPSVRQVISKPRRETWAEARQNPETPKSPLQPTPRLEQDTALDTADSESQFHKCFVCVLGLPWCHKDTDLTLAMTHLLNLKMNLQFHRGTIV